MIYDLIKASWKPLILIALVSLTITWAFNIENTLITTQIINGVEIRTFNAHTYLTNINNAWKTNALNFNDILPPLQWQEVTGNMLQNQFWEALLNNLAFIANWAYFPINFILWLFRWVTWLINILLALIGWNTQQRIDGSYYSNLVMINEWVTQNLMIPYIQP